MQTRDRSRSALGLRGTCTDLCVAHPLSRVCRPASNLAEPVHSSVSWRLAARPPLSPVWTLPGGQPLIQPDRARRPEAIVRVLDERRAADDNGVHHLVPFTIELAGHLTDGAAAPADLWCRPGGVGAGRWCWTSMRHSSRSTASTRKGAASHYKGGTGSTRCLCFTDDGRALAVIPRPANAAANSGADQLEICHHLHGEVENRIKNAKIDWSNLALADQRDRTSPS